jgi:DNA excision repair protein ERCC-2
MIALRSRKAYKFWEKTKSMILFPYATVRPAQEEFMVKVLDAVTKAKDLIIHAPTGLGKTAAALAPALSYALEHKKTIFFLTSRHTQHDIALKTLEAIKLRHGKDILAVDIIGKKWMCSQPSVDRLPSQEFGEFCRALREDGKCNFFSKLKKGESLTVEGKLAVAALKEQSPVRNQVIISTAQQYGLCPYYLSMELTKKAQVIIGDYFYVFHPKIREQFFAKSDNELEDVIIIVDEAHNLPQRIKDLASARLSNIVLKRAISEAEKKSLHEISNGLRKMLDIFMKYQQVLHAKNEQEMHVSREEWVAALLSLGSFDALVASLLETGDAIREELQVSYIGAVGSFLEVWQGDDEGFTRILSVRKGMKEEVVTLSYRCLDPSIVAAPIVQQAHATIMMSGTLTPTDMYKSLFGMPYAEELVFPSPFPAENKLNIIIPKTSTKFTTRTDEQYRAIAEILAKVAAAIPGNVAIFLPSYYLLQEVSKYFSVMTEKTVFTEHQEMDTSQKQDFLDSFRRYKNTGAVLLAVMTGNFGEGIDLPGDELKGVVIVGLPLQKPDLESNALIAYYDRKFRRGWDYGYLFPAFNKSLQSAGRCIRSETDRGVIVFLDERYAWPNYKRCFPKDWDIKVSLLYEELIKDFFSR